jgi:hypothetical protein
VVVVRAPKFGRRELGIAIILLTVLATVIVVYALPIDLSGLFPNPKYSDKYGIVVETYAVELLPNGTFVRHDPITEEYTARWGGYWNLTAPDKYVLEAIGNPGEMILVSMNAPDLMIVQQLEQHNWIDFIKYNQQLYRVTVYGTPKNKWV